MSSREEERYRREIGWYLLPNNTRRDYSSVVEHTPVERAVADSISASPATDPKESHEQHSL